MSQAGRLERLADLIVGVGANIQPDQDVVIRGLVEHAGIARAITERAYAAGARRVVVDYEDNHVLRAAIAHAPLEALTSHYRYEAERIEELRERRGAVISLSGDAEADLFDGLDPERRTARSLELARIGMNAIDSGDLQWTVVPAPNDGWAKQIFGEPDIDRLWDAVSTALRLDEPDPVAAWRAHLERLQARRDALNALALDRVRLRGGGTDLTVGLIAGATWLSGGSTAKNGVFFVPNLPTEEVFTSPDLTRAEGTAQVTKPLALPRGLVVGLRLRLEGGRIVEVTAERGRDMVEAELRSHPRAAQLGEVALVDADSAVAAAGIVFHNTVFDENAGCHIAYGRAYAEALPGAEVLEPQDLLARGLNDAAVHTDVVIGGPELDVDGITPEGRSVAILRGNRWVLPVEAADGGAGE